MEARQPAVWRFNRFFLIYFTNAQSKEYLAVAAATNKFKNAMQWIFSQIDQKDEKEILRTCKYNQDKLMLENITKMCVNEICKPINE